MFQKWNEKTESKQLILTVTEKFHLNLFDGKIIIISVHKLFLSKMCCSMFEISFFPNIILRFKAPLFLDNLIPQS